MELDALYEEFGKEPVGIVRRELTAKSGKIPSYIELLAELYLRQGPDNNDCSWQFVADTAGTGEEVYLEPENPFVGTSYDADAEIDNRIARFEAKTGLGILGVCLRSSKI